MTEGTTLADKLHPNWSLARSWAGGGGLQRTGCARRGESRKFKERVGQGRLYDSFLLSKRLF